MARRKPWSERIEAAEKRGRFTAFEAKLAGEWSSCAIGERWGGRYFWIQPGMSKAAKDREDDLGVNFAYAVGVNNIPEAKRIFAAIQALPHVEVPS